MSKSEFSQSAALAQWLGVEIDPVSPKEKIVSMLGGFISILLILAISQSVLQLSGATLIVASAGASAVLLFAVPHGQLSQPWPVVAGHVFSAFIGVTCAKIIPEPMIAAGCAVGLAILAMHQFKCIHPPGGATALTAVIGGPTIHGLGYGFVIFPVFANAVIIVVVAIAFNGLFKWRRYPAYWNRKHVVPLPEEKREHEAVVKALSSLDSFVDITEDDLLTLHDLLSKELKERGALPNEG